MMRKWLCCFALLLLFGCQQDTSRSQDALTVYSPYPQELIRPLLKDFEQQYDVRVNLIEGSTQVLLSDIHRTPLEARGDVFVGGVLSETIDHSDDFVPYQVSDVDKFHDFEFKNHLVTPFMLMPTVIVVNKDLIGSIPVRGYEDLLQPPLNARVAYSNPYTTTTGYQHMRALYHLHHNTQTIKQFQHHAVQLEKSSQVVEQVAKGRYDAGLSYELDARRWMKKGYPLKLVYPTEGTVINIDGIALVHNAHPNSKREALVKYLTGRAVQTRLAQEFGVKPIRKDLAEVSETGTLKLKDIPAISESELPHDTHQAFLERLK